MAARSSLEDLDLTGEEVERLSQAFQDEGFRALFAEYAAELADPAQRAIYEAEVAALERQRGVEARFLHPSPGWVLRTSQAGLRRCYLNLCSNRLVGRPECRPAPGGSSWSLPHCLAPGREELSRRHGAKGTRRLVYDVLFHPDTLRLAARSARFRRLVQDTALEAVEKHFSPGLDRANAVPLRGVKYKGVPQATLLRTPLPGGVPPATPGEGEGEEGGEEGGQDSPLPPFPTPYTYPPPGPERETEPPAKPEPPSPPPAATTPRWTLRQRSYVDLQDYRCSRDSAPSPVPRELVVTVELPLLTSAAQARLEIRGRELQLDSARPAAYRLRLRLPYPVDEDGGRATFHKAKGQLMVVLPVLAKPPPGAFASGQEEEQAGAEEGEGAGPSASSREPLEEEDAALPAGDEARPTEPAPPVLHVGASGEALPGCAFQRDAEAAAATSLDASPSLPGSEGGRSPPHLPVDPAWESPEPPPCEQQGASLEGEGRARPALPVCATMSGPGEACAGGGAGEEAGPDPHAAPVCAGGDSPEPPGGTPCLVADLPERPHGGLATPAALPGEIGWGHPGSSPASPIDGLLGQSADPTPAPPARPASPRAPATPALCPQTSASPSLPAGDLDPGAPGNSPGFLAGPAPLLCPPFRCTQDETALTLLFEVSSILPQSLKGQVGTNHYGVSFASQEAASYSFLLQTLPENKLTPPEVEVSVTPNNAVIVLAKSPESTGLWTKLDFGPNAESLQERWFVTENNVSKFLGHLPQPPSSGQPEMEQCPLIEVLDVSEGKSQIRLKARDHNSFPPDQAEPRREEREAHEKGSTLSADTENGPMQSGGSRRRARETMGSVGRGPDYCLALDPIGPSSAVPEKLQTCEANESGHSSTTGKDTVPSAQAQLNWKEPAQISQEEDVHSESTQSKQRLPSRPAPPVIKETNMQDGSVEYISHHATRSAVTLQNSLLYELD
ncbi:protein kintoun [Pogona vitticeps]